MRRRARGIVVPASVSILDAAGSIGDNGYWTLPPGWRHRSMPRISRRTFFVHSAHKTIGVSAGVAALQAVDWGLEPAVADVSPKQSPLEVCLVSGSLEYKSDESLAALEEYLGRNYRIRCTRAFRKSDDDLPGLENLERCDAMLLFTRRLTPSLQQLERIKRYCRGGRPIVALRTASHAFQNWLELDKEILGGDYQGHYGDTVPTHVEVAKGAEKHPVLAGFAPFVSSGSLYKNPKIAADTTVLLTGSIPSHSEPVAWTRLNHGGRLVYCSLGHPNDFCQPAFRRFLVNALYWTARRDSNPDK